MSLPSTTLIFNKNIQSTLSYISPQLAAHHASRSRKQHSDNDNDNPLQCSFCGHLGLCHRVVQIRCKNSRKGRRNSTKLKADSTRKGERYIQTTCSACDRVSRIPCPRLSQQPLSPPLLDPSLPTSSSTTSTQTPTNVEIQTRPLNIPLPSQAPKINTVHSSISPPSTTTLPHQLPNPSSSHPDPQKQPKRSKKKTGLAEMIARSKAKNSQQDQAKSSNNASGLAAFLSGL